MKIIESFKSDIHDDLMYLVSQYEDDSYLVYSLENLKFVLHEAGYNFMHELETLIDELVAINHDDYAHAIDILRHTYNVIHDYYAIRNISREQYNSLHRLFRLMFKTKND